jgi:hypothetical protein
MQMALIPLSFCFVQTKQKGAQGSGAVKRKTDNQKASFALHRLSIL